VIVAGLPDVAAVIVHHRRFPAVMHTISAVLSAGVSAQNLWVVDTSEDPGQAMALERAAGDWHLSVIPNHGYGAAVNHGVGRSTKLPFTLVLTHEALFGPEDLVSMVAALRNHPDAAVAGPDLLRADGAIWSRGGSLSPVLRLPRHRVDAVTSTSEVSDVAWIDGAIALYRTDVLLELPFREDFFLYVEETELHARIRAAGWRVVTVAGATASQSTGGTPAYWGVRNTILFQAAHGTRLSLVVTPVYVLARTALVLMVRRQWSQVPEALRGFVSGLRVLARRSA
jgi:GT2 family glycosyltransferase